MVEVVLNNNTTPTTIMDLTEDVIPTLRQLHDNAHDDDHDGDHGKDTDDENDDPQPQVVAAFGLRMMNCAPSRSSL